MQQTLTSPETTMKAGVLFAKKLRGGDVVLLHGELGAGKTTFVKGIAKGLGIKETITSPTFTLMGVYNLSSRPLSRDPDAVPAKAGNHLLDPGSRGESGMTKKKRGSGMTKRLCHIDTYRLKNADELRAIGAGDYIGDPHTITVIEWPEKITELLKKVKTKKVRFAHTKDGRTLSF